MLPAQDPGRYVSSGPGWTRRRATQSAVRAPPCPGPRGTSRTGSHLSPLPRGAWRPGGASRRPNHRHRPSDPPGSRRGGERTPRGRGRGGRRAVHGRRPCCGRGLLTACPASLRWAWQALAALWEASDGGDVGHHRARQVQGSRGLSQCEAEAKVQAQDVSNLMHQESSPSSHGRATFQYSGRDRVPTSVAHTGAPWLMVPTPRLCPRGRPFSEWPAELLSECLAELFPDWVADHFRNRWPTFTGLPSRLRRGRVTRR